MHAIVHFTTSLSPQERLLQALLPATIERDVMISQLVSVPAFSVRILESSARPVSSFMNIKNRFCWEQS